MLIWVILVILVIVALAFLRMDHFGRKVKIIFIIVAGLMIYFSIVSLFTSENVDLTSPGGIVKAVYLYFGWIGRTLSGLWDVGKDSVSAVGKAVKLNMTG